jgi:methionine biosynthesis protein MetW
MSKTEHLYMPEDHMDEIYHSKNPLDKLVHVGRLKTIVKEMPSGKGLKVLDAGCGEGHLLEMLHEKNKSNKYYGIDITDIALKKAKKRCPFAKIQKMDLSKIKYADASFDVITCTEVLEHVYEYKDVLKEFRRILKKDGHLIITFPNETLWTFGRFILGRRPIKVPDHVNSFTPSRMRSSAKLQLVSQVNIPFRLPFFLSPTCLMKFRK